MCAGLLGHLTTPVNGHLLVGGPWVLDNGCFSDVWNEAAWQTKLEKLAGDPDCLFAVVPDVVYDAAGTDERWARYAPIVKAHGYQAAYVTQNGCTHVPDDADVVFTGGDNEWKMSDEAQRLAANHDGWTHMGRVNTLRRLRFAFFHGYDSVDGTFLAFGPDVNLPRLLRYLRSARQPTLFTGGH